MKELLLGVGAAVLLLLPASLHAQAPVVLVCQDGTTQPGSSKVACQHHGGMDWDATRTWTEMRAGRFAEADTVVCTDGQTAPAGRSACAQHGGVDSVSTLAAVRKRAKARRFAGQPAGSSNSAAYQPGDVSADTSPNGRTGRDSTSARSTTASADSTKWGYPVNRQPRAQNPAGYRGMERPVNLVPADSGAVGDSAAPADATSRINQRRRQDSAAREGQNPPGYRGMERPAALDSSTSER